jgi:hypothetical protein
MSASDAQEPNQAFYEEQFWTARRVTLWQRNGHGEAIWRDSAGRGKRDGKYQGEWLNGTQVNLADISGNSYQAST